MSKISKIIEHNRHFVKEKKYEKYETSKYPNKKVAILTCMDTRLEELLPAALGIKNGDVKMIKNAGAVISHPFGSIMRSLLIGVYLLQVDEIMIIGHRDCGMQVMQSNEILDQMRYRGISNDTISTLVNSGINLHDWLQGFSCEYESVKKTVAAVTNHPLMPDDIAVSGFIIDPNTGELEIVIQAFSEKA